MTALHHAMTLSSQDIAERLIQHGANVTAVDRFGNTVLHFLANVRKVTVKESFLKLILQKGAAAVINELNQFGETPLHLGNLKEFVDNTNSLSAWECQLDKTPPLLLCRSQYCE